MFAVPWLLLVACKSPPLPEGSVVDDDWARAASELDAVLEVPCDGVTGGLGRYEVAIDDASGWATLIERDTGRVFLRDPFGVLPDRCWWLPPASKPYEAWDDPSCATDGFQLGTCTRDAAAPNGWLFFTPGVAAAPAPIVDAANVDGVLLAVADGAVQRLDLTPSSDQPVDDTESYRTFHTWLPDLGVPEGRDGFADGRVAAADDVVVTWDPDAGRVAFFPRDAARTSLAEATDHRGTPSRDGALAAAGAFAVVATDRRVDVYSALDGATKRDKRDHSALSAGVLDAAVHPDTGIAWVLVPDGVIGFLPEGDPDFHPTPGAEGLFLGRPGGVPTAYAWGNDDGRGVIWRLDAGGVSTAWRLDHELLGAGTGEVFQEIVVVYAGDDGLPHTRGYVDRLHVEAIPDGTIGLALAPFLESPHDPEINDVASALADLEDVGGCPTTAPPGFEDEHTVCCSQQQRAVRAAEQLAWLDRRMSADWPGGPMTVVLGINPSVIAQSHLCNQVEDPDVAALGDALPTEVGAWLLDAEARGVASAAVLGHSIPYQRDAWWVLCPDDWYTADDAPRECFDTYVTEDTFADFYDAMAARAALTPWVGREPDWRLFGGAFEDAAVDDLIDWTAVFGDTIMPDDAPAEDGLYFGNLGMDPHLPEVVAKELAPEDTRLRVFPLEVQSPADLWDGGGDGTGTTYHPGQTVALNWLWELRRSGLHFLDFGKVASVDAALDTDAIDGDEDMYVINRADFLADEHYLVARVLAHRDPSTPRFWYVHLQDLSRLRDESLLTGWIDCRTSCDDDTELDAFLLRIEAWSPQVRWTTGP